MQYKSVRNNPVRKEAKELINRQGDNIFVAKYNEDVGVSDEGYMEKKRKVKKWLKHSRQVLLSKGAITTVKLSKIKDLKGDTMFVFLR